MKKKIFVILLVLIISVAFFACSNNGSSANINIKEIGQNYIDDFFDNNFDNMVSGYNYDSTMKKAITKDFLKQTYDTVIAKTGKVVSQAEIQQKTQSGYEFVYKVVTFENVKLTVNVVFDKDNNIAGFNFQSAQ